MATKLNKQLKREIDVDGKPFMVTLSPEGLKLTEKGKRLGRELTWKDLLSGDAALSAALSASVGQGVRGSGADDSGELAGAARAPARAPERERFGRPRGASAARHGDARHRARARLRRAHRPGDPDSGNRAGPAAGIPGSALRGRPPGARRTAAPAHRRPRQGRHLVNWPKAACGAFSGYT